MRLADVLTASRVIATPVVIWLILSNEMLAAYYLFAAAAITDLLDGYFAKRSKKIATYGEIFDGVADFILVYGTILALVIEGEAFWAGVGALVSIACGVPMIALISRRKGKLAIPHVDTYPLATAVYPAVMAYIVGWQYAWILLIMAMIAVIGTTINYFVYVRST